MIDIPEFCKAAILVEQNKPLIVDYVKLPKALSVGQILVEIEVSGICGSQIGEITGAKGPDKYLPHLMGHEGCGIVLEVGPGVSTVKKGDKVVLHWRKGAGIQSKNAVYQWRDKTLNAGWVTTFNTHAVISENRCTKISNDFDSDLASLFGCAITTGFGVVDNNAKIKLGESVVVFGAGGIGLNIIQACKLNSAYPIIAVDLFENRLDLASKLGATHIINSKNQDPYFYINKIIGEKKLDVFIDNTGISSIIESGYNLLNEFGRLVLVGVPRKGKNINIFTLPLHFGKQIIGSHGGESNPDCDIPRYSKLFKNNLVDFKLLVSKRISLDNINQAISEMREGETSGRILIEMK
tara:strand:- start:1172 stop:2227 length:1056 start_codon:yes stop_codon:yes gene_type:complete